MSTQIRNSKQRALILDIVRNSPIHPDVDWIYGEAKKVMPTIGIATVYRNLLRLCEVGEIRRVSAPGERDRYDGKMKEHCHLRCRCCGKLIDLEFEGDEATSALKEQIRSTFALVSDDIQMTETTLIGTCNQCAGAAYKNVTR